MKTRLLSAIVILPLVLVSMWMGGLLFVAVILVVSVIASHECSILLTKRNINSHPFISSSLAGLIIICGFCLTMTSVPTLPITIGFTLLSLSSVIWMLTAGNNNSSTINSAFSTLAPALYPSGLMMQAALIMKLEYGFYWLILLISGTSMTDTGAYFIGKTFGRHSFFKQISPSKTIEGAIAGLVLGSITVIMVCNLFPTLRITFLQTAILSALFPIISQGGDLIESALKRQSNVKDSGKIIPGHGGVLDRLDSIVFNVALLYHFTKWIGT